MNCQSSEFPKLMRKSHGDVLGCYSLQPKLILPRSRSTCWIVTLIISPRFKSTPAGIFDLCSKPAFFTPRSIKAPNSTTFCTVPCSSMPTTRSFSVRTSFLRNGLGRSSRGSRPGWTNCLNMSTSVGTPILRTLPDPQPSSFHLA